MILLSSQTQHLRVGRPNSTSGELMIPGCAFGSLGLATITADGDVYAPWMTDHSLLIDKLVSEVTVAAGTVFRMGLYAADEDWQPIGSPLADSGDLDSSTTGVKTYTPSTPIFIPPGRYLGVVNGTGGTQFRYASSVPENMFINPATQSTVWTRFVVSRGYSAFPTPGARWDLPASGTVPTVHFVFYRIVT